jgi:hypothetical protein
MISASDEKIVIPRKSTVSPHINTPTRSGPAEQIYFTNRRFVTNTLPPPPSRLLSFGKGCLLLLVFFILFLLSSSSSSPPPFDPWETSFCHLAEKREIVFTSSTRPLAEIVGDIVSGRIY